MRKSESNDFHALYAKWKLKNPTIFRKIGNFSDLSAWQVLRSSARHLLSWPLGSHLRPHSCGNTCERHPATLLLRPLFCPGRLLPLAPPHPLAVHIPTHILLWPPGRHPGGNPLLQGLASPRHPHPLLISGELGTYRYSPPLHRRFSTKTYLL